MKFADLNVICILYDTPLFSTMDHCDKNYFKMSLTSCKIGFTMGTIQTKIKFTRRLLMHTPQYKILRNLFKFSNI